MPKYLGHLPCQAVWKLPLSSLMHVIPIPPVSRTYAPIQETGCHKTGKFMWVWAAQKCHVLYALEDTRRWVLGQQKMHTFWLLSSPFIFRSTLTNVRVSQATHNKEKCSRETEPMTIQKHKWLQLWSQNHHGQYCPLSKLPMSTILGAAHWHCSEIVLV